MSRKIWISVISIVILSLMACAKKGDTSMNDTEIKDTELKEENKYLATNFIGDSGYITENMIYDYSAFFDEVYEWAEGIKMPVPMPEGGKVAWQTPGEYSYSNPMLQHVSKSELEIALEPLKDKGFVVYIEDDDNGEKTTYSVYKENFRIVFSYDSYNENQWNVFAYMGNVIHERAVTREDAINMIEDSELLKNDEYFEKYYVFAIETESIREAGYFEFYVVPIYYLGEKAQSWMPYYMITDGDGVLLFEKGALNHIWPSNANIVETTEGAELIISGMPDYGTNMYWSYEVSGYRIEDRKFEKIWSHSSSKNYDVDTTKQGVVSRVNNGQIEYYLVEAQKDYDCSMGRKDFWQIKEKYFINKLKMTDNKETNSYLAKDYLGEAGYIVHNQIFDYSDYFETIYEWADGIKMPFEKPENSKIIWIGEEKSAPSLKLTEMDEKCVETCVESLKNAGFYVSSVDESSGVTYKLFKGNFRITMAHFFDSKSCNIYCYMGNVVGEREVSVEDARELLKKENLINVDEYYIFAIENESVGKAGYYEFIVENIQPLKEYVPWYNVSYYMITDGEKILLFEEQLLDYECPTNASLVVDGDETKLVVSGEPDRTDIYASKITGYTLKDGKFIKIWYYESSSQWDVTYRDQGVVTKVENNEIVYYLVEYVDNYDKSKGGKDCWKIKERYYIKEENIRNVEE